MPKKFQGKLSYPKLYYAKPLLCGSVFISWIYCSAMVGLPTKLIAYCK